MSIVKPYTFVGGTKARANEVNDNFDRLYEQVNTDITDIANLKNGVDDLRTNKADIQGSSTQRFSVADAVGNYDAINKQTMLSYIQNSIDIIYGYTITKDSANTILVSNGWCWDTTHSIILTTGGTVQKTNSTQVANATYYVYVIGNNDGSMVDIIITPESLNPPLPEGYTKYRKIGYYKTNGSNQISSEIVSYGYNPEGIQQPTAVVVESYVNGYTGYIRFNNGYKLEWGIYYIHGGDNNYNVTLPYAFDTINYNVQLSWNAHQNAGDKRMNLRWLGRTTTGFGFESQLESFNSQDSTVFWFCTGF